MDWRHLCCLLSLLVDTMMHEPEAELDEHEDEDEDANHLMCRVEIFRLRVKASALEFGTVRPSKRSRDSPCCKNG